MTSKPHSTARPDASRGPRLAVAVTRPLPAGLELADRLEARGFRAVLLPTLAIVPPRDGTALRDAAARLLERRYAWVAFTSANAVRALGSTLAELGNPRPHPFPARVAAVGRATAAAVRALGWRVDRLGAEASAEGLLRAFEEDLAGTHVLLPAAEAARDVLPRGLRDRGGKVDVVVAYRTVVPPEAPSWDEVREAGGVDVLTFTSPSSAAHLLEASGDEVLALPAIAIGPVTGAAAEALGFRVVRVAEAHSAEGLVEAVTSWARERG